MEKMTKKNLPRGAATLVDSKEVGATIVINKPLHKRYRKKCMDDDRSIKSVTESLITMYIQGKISI